MPRPNLSLITSDLASIPDASAEAWASLAQFQDGVCAQRAALVARGLMLTSSPAAADDLAQDTIERTLRAGPGKMGPAHLHQWMMVVLRNQFVCQWRSGRRLQPLDADACDELPAPVESPAPAWTAYDAADVQAAVATLSDGLRRTFELHAVGGWSYRAIAQAIGIPVGTVGTRLMRARRQIKAALETTPARSSARSVPAGARRWDAPLIDDSGDAARPLLRDPSRCGDDRLHARSAG